MDRKPHASRCRVPHSMPCGAKPTVVSEVPNSCWTTTGQQHPVHHNMLLPSAHLTEVELCTAWQGLLVGALENWANFEKPEL